MSKDSDISYSWLTIDEIARIGEIDRSELVQVGYHVQDGELRSSSVEWNMPDWLDQENGEHSVEEQIQFSKDHMQRGARALGAFCDDRLIGIGIMQPQLTGSMAQLANLQVSRPYRRRGIANELAMELIEFAREQGADCIYVSATPSESAVGFYLNLGFKLTDRVDPELYALEPEDIHMIKRLD